MKKDSREAMSSLVHLKQRAFDACSHPIRDFVEDFLLKIHLVMIFLPVVYDFLLKTHLSNIEVVCCIWASVCNSKKMINGPLITF